MARLEEDPEVIPLQNHRVCALTGKIVHRTEGLARAAMRQVTLQGKKHPKRWQYRPDVFKCDHCHGWHFGKKWRRTKWRTK